MSTKIAILLFGLLSINFANAEFKEVFRKHIETVRSLRIDNVQENLVYTTCEVSFSRNKQCTIYQEAFDGKYNRSCEIKLDPNYKLHYLNKDKVMISWYNTLDVEPNFYIRFSIVDFTNCSIIEPKLLFTSADEQYINTVRFMYDTTSYTTDVDKFEVLFTNSSIGTKDEIFKLTFDMQGKIINGPTSSGIDSLNNNSFILREKVNSHTDVIADCIYNENCTFSIVKSYDQKAEEMVLTEMNNETMDYFYISTQYDTVSICAIKIQSIHVDCLRYDQNAKLISNHSIDLKHNVKMYSLNVYNRKNGGFFLTYANENDEHLYLIAFNGAGEKVADIELPGYGCESGYAFEKSYFEATEDYYCATKVCYHSENDKIVDRMCFEPISLTED